MNRFITNSIRSMKKKGDGDGKNDQKRKKVYIHTNTHTQHERQLKKAACTVLTEGARFKCKFHGEADAGEYKKTAGSRKTEKKRFCLDVRYLVNEERKKKNTVVTVIE